MVRYAFQVDFNCNKFQDIHSKIKKERKEIQVLRKCAQLGLRIQDGSLFILLRITSEPLQLRKDHRKEGVGTEILL